ncbi:MAG: hypothetical protein JNK17_14795 [Hydrogenophaga sp.]|uniref:hypothetical protein n=1 Tax=Hydrogenophaga sp. TaxID=1904254 RepID=UPI001A4033C7|nr:hypothetical protein [Hydrogenophaga sp.]
MTKDNPDTFVMEDQTEWEATQVDDVFLPSVQVLVRWSDVESAVARGAIVPTEAHGLWASWAAPGSPMRRMAQLVEQPYQSTQPEDSQMDDLPHFQAQGGGMKSVMMLLLGAAVGAALMFVLKG